MPCGNAYYGGRETAAVKLGLLTRAIRPYLYRPSIQNPVDLESCALWQPLGAGAHEQGQLPVFVLISPRTPASVQQNVLPLECSWRRWHFLRTD